ncbi:MAG: 2-oxo acid dehydrogenase subunit E2 [Lachnospiraceae bacterium]|nr:2-oxo acid dehydrogenase subunit E2 [Lachnospiraceae bacterium]
MKAKRRWKDRRDGTLIRDIDGMHYVMPLMYPNRCDNEAYMTINISVDNTEAFIRQMNRENPENRITMFIIIITAILKTIALRPQMNRFIANKNVYQRNELTAAFTVKKTFSDDGDETLARIEASHDDDIFTLANKINEQIALCKTGTDESTDAMEVIKKLPFKHLIGAIARFLDRHGWMPRSVIATDPYQCSVVLTNLGSIGMNIGYHHLMNWGTTSLFLVVGKKHNRAHFDQDGNMTMKRELSLSFTIDERISDGYYYARSLKLLKKLIENPELLTQPISTEVKY